jgi:hypothetical protein
LKAQAGAAVSGQSTASSVRTVNQDYVSFVKEQLQLASTSRIQQVISVCFMLCFFDKVWLFLEFKFLADERLRVQLRGRDPNGGESFAAELFGRAKFVLEGAMSRS